MASKKKAAPAKKAPAKKKTTEINKTAPAKKAVAKRVVKKHPLIDAKESKTWKDAIVKKKADDAAKKTTPAKPIIKSNPVVKKKVVKKVTKVVEKVKEEDFSQKKSIVSRYSHLLMPVENFEEEPLKEVAESKEALSQFKYDVEIPGESAPITEAPKEPVSEHGTTVSNIRFHDGGESDNYALKTYSNALFSGGTNVEIVTTPPIVSEWLKEEMSVEPDAIVFKSPGVFVEEKDVEHYCGCKDIEGEYEEPTDEEYEEGGDLEIVPSYIGNKRYGAYVAIIIFLLIISIFFFATTPSENTVPLVPTTDTIHKADTVVVTKTDTVVIDSIIKTVSKTAPVNKNISVSYKSQRERDSIAVELNKNAPPLIIKH